MRQIFFYFLFFGNVINSILCLKFLLGSKITLTQFRTQLNSSPHGIQEVFPPPPPTSSRGEWSDWENDNYIDDDAEPDNVDKIVSVSSYIKSTVIDPTDLVKRANDDSKVAVEYAFEINESAYFDDDIDIDDNPEYKWQPIVGRQSSSWEKPIDKVSLENSGDFKINVGDSTTKIQDLPRIPATENLVQTSSPISSVIDVGEIIGRINDLESKVIFALGINVGMLILIFLK